MLERPAHKSWLVRLQDYFLWLLILSYLLATFWPEWGLRFRQVKFASLGSTGVDLTFVSLMLSWLLFSAGLGLSVVDVRAVTARPSLLIGGLATNLVVPLLFLGALSAVVFPWMEADQSQVLLTGLAIVAAVPIASSSTAWCQNANGNLALSLGLLLFSTLLSPFSTPFVLHFADRLGPDESAGVVQQLSPLYAISFLVSFVLLPMAAGIVVRWAITPARVASIQAFLKSANLACLLLLNYSNAAISLPQIIVGPPNRFILLIVVMTGLMCCSAFAGAYFLARLMRADTAQRTALLFGMGMNNNGVGLVLASLAVAMDTRVLLPVIFYNLWQHFIAGAVDHWFCRTPRHVE